MSLLKRLAGVVGLDFHVTSTLLARSWTAFAGIVMMLGIPHWFSASEQGMYFTFYSLLGLQVFFELGFSFVVVQFVSHETAELDFASARNFDNPGYERLASLVKLMAKWYAVISVIFVIVVSLSGVVFFKKAGADGAGGWMAGWGLLVLCSGANLFLSPFLAIAEGAGFIGQVARLRFAQSVVGYILLWLFLQRGAGLSAVPIVSFASVVGTSIWLTTSGRFILTLARKPISKRENVVDWRTEILPFQWKIALSWMSGYLTFQLFNPVLFAFQGAIQAGRIGLALTVFNTLLGISLSWVMAKIPAIGRHIARGERRTALSLFKRLAVRANLFHFLSCVMVLCVFLFFKMDGLAVGSRLPDFSALICLAAISQLNVFTGAVAAYLRAHGTEPLLVSSLVMSVLSTLCILLGAQFGTFLSVFLYLLATAFVGLPWLMIVAIRFERDNASQINTFGKSGRASA